MQNDKVAQIYAEQLCAVALGMPADPAMQQFQKHIDNARIEPSDNKEERKRKALISWGVARRVANAVTIDLSSLPRWRLWATVDQLRELLLCPAIQAKTR